MKAAALAALAIFLGAREAAAYEVLQSAGGATLTWAATTIDYGVDFELDDAPGEAIASASRRAFDTVDAVLVGRAFVYVGPGPRQMDDDRVTVATTTPWIRMRDDVATTLFVYDATTGVVRDADILLNTEAFSFGDSRGSFDTESVVLHEAGHVMGLDHSCGTFRGTFPSCFSVPDQPPGTRDRVLEAVMAPTLAPGVSRRAFNDDDREGLAALYLDVAIRDPSPIVVTATRTCPGDRLTITTAPTVGVATISIRASSGVVAALEPTRDGDVIVVSPPPVADVSRSVDVIVDDVSTGESGAAVGLDLRPPECAGPPPPPETGCDCTTGRSGPSLLLLAFGLLFVRRRTFVALLAAAWMVSVAPDAHAFRCSRVGVEFGPSLVWNTRTIGWVLDDELTTDLPSATVIEQVQLSFSAWENVNCSDMTLPYLGQKVGVQAGFRDNAPNDNAVVFLKTKWPYDPAVIAVTTNAFDTRTGVVFDSDIEVNDEHFTFVVADQACDEMKGQMDLRNAMTHEVGHVVGLDHPPLTPPRFAEATMFASAPSCETKKRSLDQDDIDGFCSIYPSGQPYQQCFPPEGQSFLQVESDDGFGCSHNRVPRRSWPLSLLLLAFVVLRRSKVDLTD